MTGQMWNTAATPCVITFTYSATQNAYLGSLTPVTMQTTPASCSYRLDTMQSNVFLIPQLQSGRCMVSLNYQMQMPPVVNDSGQISLQEPNINNPLDANSGIVFDKFEFSFDNTNTLYIDPTAVDFFAIPVSISVGGSSSGAPLNTTRDVLMKKMISTLKANDKTANKIWSTLIMDTVEKSDTMIYRLAAPYLAPEFDLTYLSNATTYTLNYIDTLCAHYANTQDTVVINCTELNSTGFEVFDIYNVLPSADPGAYLFYGVMSANGQSWNFTNNPLPTTGQPVTRTIDMGSASSFDFFAPGVAPFDTPNKTIKSILVRQITAAFTVGLLPAPAGMMLDSNYLSNPGQYPYYKTNKRISGAGSKNGPWYNAYTQAVHSAIPQLYAFAFDDELGQSGTLVSSNTSDTVSLVIGSMGKAKVPKYTYYPPLVAPAITNSPSFTQDTTTNTWSATISYTVPAGSPTNAQFYFLPFGGAGYITPADTLVAWQLKSPPASTAGTQTYTLTLPDSVFVGGNANGAGINAISCGGSYACPTSTNVFLPGGPAATSGPVPLCATNVSWSTPTPDTAAGDTTGWTFTVNWSVPANQIAGVKYWWILNGANVMNTDSIISLQLPGYSPINDTSVSVTVPARMLSSTPVWANAQLQILTCGGVSVCPTSANIFVPQGAGALPVKPSVSKPAPAPVGKPSKAPRKRGKG